MRLLITLLILVMLLGIGSAAFLMARAEEAKRLETEAARDAVIATLRARPSEGVYPSSAPVGVPETDLLTDENALLREQVESLQAQVMELRTQIEALKAAREEGR